MQHFVPHPCRILHRNSILHARCRLLSHQSASRRCRSTSPSFIAPSMQQRLSMPHRPLPLACRFPHLPQVLTAVPLKLPCIIAQSNSKSAGGHPAMRPNSTETCDWSISHETVVATTSCPHASPLFLSQHAKQRMQQVIHGCSSISPHCTSCNVLIFASSQLTRASLQRGIQPSDIADAVSKGRVSRSSKQNLLFQTKVLASPTSPPITISLIPLPLVRSGRPARRHRQPMQSALAHPPRIRAIFAPPPPESRFR